MANNGTAQTTNEWHMPQFRFEVKWDNEVMSFKEVSGMDSEKRSIAYRQGGSPELSVVKMPGIKRHGTITMKYGTFKSDNKIWDWFNQIKTNAIKRIPVTISLLDEVGAPTIVWTLANAWPTRVSGTDLKAHGNDVAIDTIEVAYESINIDNA